MVVFKMVFFSFFSFSSTLFECFPRRNTIVCVFMEMALVDFPYKEIMAWQKLLTVISRFFESLSLHLQIFTCFSRPKGFSHREQSSCPDAGWLCSLPLHILACWTEVFTMHPSVIEMWLELFSGQSLHCERRNTLTNGPTINIGAL